jgi:ESCRT-II complex subunit VPS36
MLEQGQRELLSGEVEVLSQSQVTIKCVDGTLNSISSIMLTNYRIIFLAANEIIQVPVLLLKYITSVEKIATFISGKRLHIVTSGTFPLKISIKFNAAGIDEFTNQLQYFLGKKSWMASVIDTPPIHIFRAPTSAGIAGIMRKQQRDIASIDSLQQSSLSDLKSLITHAQDVIKIIEQYTLVKRGLIDENNESEENELETILRDIGYMTPILKNTTSNQSLYFQKLSSQISDFLCIDSRIFEKGGGIITLTDAYYMYNRARGSSLLSPEDFFKACENLKNNLIVKRYPSGVIVILSQSLDATIIMSERILELTNTFGKISILDISRDLKLSLVIAKEHLLAVETQGFLCRDECLSGIFFYPNLFCIM